MSYISRTLLVLPLTLLAAVATAAKVPTLTGTWKANMEKSSFGGPAPKALLYKIKDTPEGFFMSAQETDADGKETTAELKFDRGGKETLNKMGDMESRTVLTDVEDAIKEVTTFTGPNGTFTRKSTITLSPDGKTLTMNSVFTTEGGDNPVTIILEKQ